ncbi:winged helix-turn-helix domain-containing protein [Nocardia sp. NPDC058058]|uniref:winged helix-turn-helix domain-containing protein n=1 Tax=Nocardia sp. NPDC058058 TaxID=3346317 RepID=UPI0036DAA2E8
MTDELGTRVVTGHYRPGTLLPSVRKLADEFGISKSTAQVALSRLEASRFVIAERGRGFVVQDVRRCGGFDVYGTVFRLSMADPPHAVAIFTDIVNLGRDLIIDLLGDYFQLSPRPAHGKLTALVDAMEVSARRPQINHTGFLLAEFGLLREIALTIGQSATVALLNSLSGVILQVPQAVDAYYASDPSAHVLIWRALVNALDRPEPPHEAEYALVGDMLALYHQRVIEKFTGLIAPADRHPRASAESA